MRFLKDNWAGAVFSGFVGALIGDVWGLVKLIVSSVVVGINWHAFNQFATNPGPFVDFATVLSGILFVLGYVIVNRGNFNVAVGAALFLNGSVLSSFGILTAMSLFAPLSTFEIYVVQQRFSIALAAAVGTMFLIGEFYPTFFPASKFKSDADDGNAPHV